mmetsp:Transcript_3652/g.7549  ORF Transcript_3652/g.7549 Transcript_3652/m.7549 type:complete len:214 (+) Transcript_3652:64-705(+)
MHGMFSVFSFFSTFTTQNLNPSKRGPSQNCDAVHVVAPSLRSESFLLYRSTHSLIAELQSTGATSLQSMSTSLEFSFVPLVPTPTSNPCDAKIPPPPPAVFILSAQREASNRPVACDRRSPHGPSALIFTSTFPSLSALVGPRFTTPTGSPLSPARSTNRYAEKTSRDVPTTRRAPASSTSLYASSRMAALTLSPKKVTSGFTMPPHLLQTGT